MRNSFKVQESNKYLVESWDKANNDSKKHIVNIEESTYKSTLTSGKGSFLDSLKPQYESLKPAASASSNTSSNFASKNKSTSSFSPSPAASPSASTATSNTTSSSSSPATPNTTSPPSTNTPSNNTQGPNTILGPRNLNRPWGK